MINEQAVKYAQAQLNDIAIVNKSGIMYNYNDLYTEKFAQLIVEECRTVINDVYHKTPLELCGPLLTVDEEIMNHFYGVKE
jgi:hypothetical protein